jgi:hypothetical protein
MKPEIPAVTYFCLCGAAWHTLEDLKAHQTESRHTPTVNYESPRTYAPADSADDLLHWARAGATVPEAPYALEVPAPDSDIILNPTDPFDAAVAEIVRINRRKRADYALDGGDVFSNFRQTSEVIAVEGFGPADSALFNVIQKVMRLRSLRANGRMDDPANEATADTYLDLAVYAIIALALSREEV